MHEYGTRLKIEGLGPLNRAMKAQMPQMKQALHEAVQHVNQVVSEAMKRGAAYKAAPKS